MKSLKRLLIDYQQDIANSLKGSKDNVEIPFKKEDFIIQLQAISGRNRIFLWINVGMLLTVFFASIGVIYHFLDHPEKLSTIFGASGITISGMIYYMTYLWRQIVAIDLTIAVLDKLDKKALPAIINGLLSTISPHRGGRRGII